ncbi:TetR/AcrR family transcriptional regulator [Roseospira visakhapatnamensis]|uniref:AcrR family transcriptional regulator n=1 Tax=Roseospira visakhapatnamensis TaxID=390880 RepID=A0A7W6REZ7_9PROT|nr:TetR/AcrR family transcriptional regulator [Roseospira visakhapatnamensis]MBB4267087.1 AcrR family transcriptional regulator [Roseospira visakhapatnamensis]
MTSRPAPRAPARTGPPNRQARGEARRQAMLEAGIAVFLEHGYAGASLDLVIARSGGSRRTLYEHFGNKEGLFLAATEALCRRNVGHLSSLEYDASDPEEALVTAARAFVSALIEPEMLAGFRTIMGEVTRFPTLMDTFLRQGPDQAYAQVAAWLRRQARAGTLAVGDADVAARHFIELIKGDLHLRALLRPDVPPSPDQVDEHVRQAVRVFLYGVAGAPADGP